CSAAVDQLVAQHVQSIKQHAENKQSLLSEQRRPHAPLAALEALLPILVTRHAVVMAPERLEHVAVGQQRLDGLGETLPDGIVNGSFRIIPYNLAEIVLKAGALAHTHGFGSVVAISRIECDPVEDELRIRVVRL